QLLLLDPSTDVAQTYHRFNLGGTLNPNLPVLQETALMLYYFGDDFSSNEFQIISDSKLGFSIAGTDLDFGLHLNFLSGSFDFLDNQGLNGDYSFLNLGLTSPEISVEQGDFEALAGLEVVFANDLENSENDLYVYPKVNLSYALPGGYKLFGEATGGLQQHSFRTLADENPFVASALFIAATDNKLNLKTGIDGSITEGLFFSLFAKYRIEDNKALFAKRDFNSLNSGQEAFDFGNSFNVIYDDVNTLSFGLSAEYEFSNQLRFNLSGEYFDYSLDGKNNPLEIAANLPDYQVAFTTYYRPADRWSLRLGLNLVGEREAFGFELPTPGAVEEVAIKKSLDAYLDANLEIGYQINERFSAFLRGNNLLDDDYQRWNDFSVQGIQVLGGLSYKFDW
ncbi:MAG: TonB-dependent receptor, partial [Flavobacteriaceae bacterium]|nr:TonB-dependent receptor [Flavobacteriaceae bacterium]